MNIAFCINPIGLIGLGATVLSLLRNCSNPAKLTLWFFCAGVSKDDKAQLTRLLDSENFDGKYRIVDFNPVTLFGDLCSLHGDWTAYGRLLLADHIGDEQVLYLDSDLLVELDVLEVYNFNFDGLPLAAVGGGSFKYTLGNKFYINTIGLPADADYFNSGVLLVNLEKWRSDNVKDKCLQIASKYPKELPSHDQSLLNIFCAGSFAKLPQSFNCAWLSYESKPTISDKMILHFVGSPKPWDPFGHLIHNGYHTWLKYANHEWQSYFNKLTINQLARLWHLRRSYARNIIWKFRAT